LKFIKRDGVQKKDTERGQKGQRSASHKKNLNDAMMLRGQVNSGLKRILQI
jgi:hypothetical protein